MKAILLEGEDGQIVAYIKRGTFRDVDHAYAVLDVVDGIKKDECLELHYVEYNPAFKLKDAK